MSLEPTSTSRRPRFGTRDLLDTFGGGRVCSTAECSTVLSQYNAKDRCGVHDTDD